MAKTQNPGGLTYWPTDVPAEDAPYVVRVDWGEFDGRWEPKAIRVATRLPEETGPITGAVLRALPIGRIVATMRSRQKTLAQQTVDRDVNPVTLEARGRHDPCVLPRAVPMVEAMVCLVLADHWLRQRMARLRPDEP